MTDDFDELSVDVRDASICGELSLVARVRVIDLYDNPRELLLATEAAEELRDALAAALDGEAVEHRQYRCGRPKRDGSPCGTPVARYGIACGHRHADTAVAR